MRYLIVILVFFLCSIASAFDANSGATTQPSGNALLLSPGDVKKVDSIITAILKAGFPDALHAEVYSGQITVRATFDPGKDPMPLPSEASGLQETIPNSSRVIYGYQFDGLHFKLPDGSWIFSLSYHFVPRKGDEVNVQNAKKINLAMLTADARAAHPMDAAKAAKSLARVAPEQRELSTAAVTEVAPVLNYLRIGPDSLAPATVLLHQAGWPQADDLTLAIADIRSRLYWQVHPWVETEAPFDPTGQYPQAKAQEQAWQQSQPFYRPEGPDIALRRAMFRVCRAQIMLPDPESRLLSIDIAANVAKTVVDEKDPQGNVAKIDAMVAGSKLPVTPAAGAGLATRLQSWEARPRMPKMVVTSPAGNGPAISTGFVAPQPAYVPAKEDIDALVALLADDRPSRFYDFSGPRTIGDNAWRALAALLNDDPRTLAGYPADRPWTDNERIAAAKALQVWWKQHRGEYVGK
jgi:hypothetical protein